MSHSILIVDDNKLVTDIVKMRLEMHGYRVRTAQDGADALLKIETVVPDLVILNDRMARLDGYEVCQQLRQNTALHELRVIMLISEAEPRGNAAGIDDQLDKERELLDLPNRVQMLLGA